MKITETIQRDCCNDRKDLKTIEGSPLAGRDPIYKFCVHCGRHFAIHSFMDPAGSSDWQYRKQPLPWEKR